MSITITITTPSQRWLHLDLLCVMAAMVRSEGFGMVLMVAELGQLLAQLATTQ
jgi:hypothetical protein